MQEAAASVRDRDGLEHLQAILEFAPLKALGIDSITIGTLLAAALVVLLTLLVSTLLQRGIRRVGKRHATVNQAALYTISRLAHYLVIVIGVVVALSVAGVPLSQFAVFAGAAGVGLGFGLQAVFSNFISGIILLFDRSLKVGDFVELESDTRGVVRAINIRSTLITTNDNIDVLVPNAEFINGRVVNWTHGSLNRRVRVPFSVASGTDKLLVKKAAVEAAARVPFTLAVEGEKRPQVWLVGFGDGSIEFLLVVWLTEEAARRNAGVKAAYLWELDSSLAEHGIRLATAERELYFRGLFGRTGDEAAALLRSERVQRGEQGNDVRAEPELAPHERDLLARNDARDDTVRQIRQDAQETAERERRAASAGADDDKNNQE